MRLDLLELVRGNLDDNRRIGNTAGGCRPEVQGHYPGRNGVFIHLQQLDRLGGDDFDLGLASDAKSLGKTGLHLVVLSRQFLRHLCLLPDDGLIRIGDFSVQTAASRARGPRLLQRERLAAFGAMDSSHRLSSQVRLSRCRLTRLCRREPLALSYSVALLSAQPIRQSSRPANGSSPPES